MSLQKHHQIVYKILMSNTLPSALAEWLTKMRQGENLTIRGLSKKVRITHTTLADIENGMKASVNVCKKLADYFNVPQDFILRLNGTLDDKANVDSVFISGTTQIMEKMGSALQEDIYRYAIHRLKTEQEKTSAESDKSGIKKAKHI